MAAWQYSTLRPGSGRGAHRAGRLTCAADFQLRICTNKTCKKQGSAEIARFARDLLLEELDVSECGCLGQCGAGPNVAIVPTDGSAPLPVLPHMATPARLSAALGAICGIAIDPTYLKATELRLAGNAAARGGSLAKAESLFLQALDLQPPRGRHVLLSNLSATRLARGDAPAALAAAEEAVACAPPAFTTADVRAADALFALGRFADAAAALEAAAQRSPEFGRSTEYRNLMRHVSSALQKARR